MLRTCDSFADEFRVQFNAKKSQHLIACKNKDLRLNVCTLYLNGSAIEKVNTAILLGTCIGDNCELRSIDKACGDMIFRTNVLISKFSYCSSNVLSRLFDSYCSSYYACPLWNLEHACLNKLLVSWKKCMKRIWRVSQRTRSDLIPFIISKPFLDVQLMSRFISFVFSCSRSTNHVVGLTLELAKRSKTAVAKNIRIVLSFLNVDFSFLRTMCIDRVKQLLNQVYYSNIPVSTACHGQVVAELCSMRDGYTSSPLNAREINELIDFLCLDSV